MAKYTVTIQFETNRNLKFPSEAEVLDAMLAQLESLSDGDICNDIEVSDVSATIKEEQ